MSVHADPSASAQFREHVASRFGLRFEDAKLGFLADLLRRRSAARGTGIEGYLAGLGDDPVENSVLAEELTVGETFFFRNNDQFRAFSGHVLPERMRMRGSAQRLSFLSAGCSSGEEPYTLAMLTRSLLAIPPWEVSIRAIDLNPAALRKAASGRYGNWALRETPPEMLSRWFVEDGRDMVVRDELRDAVRFDRRNLADETADIWQPGAYDAIFCRNVIMYFTPAVQQAVVARLASSLAPGGYLFLGHAETLRGLSRDFHLVHTHNTFYYRRRDDGEARESDVSTLYSRTTDGWWPGAATDDADWYEAIGAASRRIETLTRPEPQPEAVPTAVAPLWNLEIAMDLLQRERFSEALELLDEVPPAAAGDPDVLLLQAVLLAQGGRLAAAAETCRALLADDELNAGAHYVLGLCFEGVADRAAAIEAYTAAVHLDPLFAMPLLRRGLLARRAGDDGSAGADLTLARDLLQREDTSRLVLFGGGFTRAALTKLCEAELAACGSPT